MFFRNQGILLLLEDKKINKFYNLCTESQVDFGALKGTTEDRINLKIKMDPDVFKCHYNKKLSLKAQRLYGQFAFSLLGRVFICTQHGL